MKVFIGNLSAEVTSYHLCLLFSDFGEVVATNVATDEEGVSRRFGYVLMKEPEAAQEAIDILNKTKFMGQYVSVIEALYSEKHSNSVAI